jgi:hypothetical protein
MLVHNELFIIQYARYEHKSTEIYVSEAVSASFIRYGAPKLLYPLYKAILRHWVPQKHPTSVGKLLKTELVRGL